MRVYILYYWCNRKRLRVQNNSSLLLKNYYKNNYNYNYLQFTQTKDIEEKVENAKLGWFGWEV